MAFNPELLLFVEPNNEPSRQPILDALTFKMTASFRKAKRGSIHDYQVMGKEYIFREGDGYMGVHSCSCGARSGTQCLLLPNGEMTNDLCIHYLAYHRYDISKEQLDRVAQLDDGKVQPDAEEMQMDMIKYGKKEYVHPMTRQEYLDKEK